MSDIANHLWQSTVFAGVVVLLALALRKNHASIRYGLWLTASVKFLLPFSLLIAVGRQVDWPSKPVEPAAALISVVQPFSSAQSPVATPETVIQTVRSVHTPVAPAPPSRLPMILLTLWLSGAGFVMLLWLRDWRRMRLSLKNASEVDFDMPLRVFIAETPTEPGIVGVLRPVLLLPKGLQERLTPAQFESVVTHELCHVRRRDNLAAALHMVVETIFWFHPLVWWIERRLVEERERACDEEVIRRGGEPEAYAEGILSVCKFYKESALMCVSGVAGADLKRRIEEIMGNRVAHKLSLIRAAVLVMAGIVAVGGPIAIGAVQGAAVQTSNAYTFSIIEYPGSKATTASGIDSGGRIVGQYTDDSGTHGFLFDNGAYVTIDYPGMQWTVAYGVNTAGQIVGAYGQDERTGRHGFLLNRGTFSTFDFPGSVDTVARGLNNKGQIVGDYLGPDGLRHGFLLSGGQYSMIEFPESGEGIASAINDSGQIVGLAGSGSKQRGFVFSGGQYAAVQFPETNFTAVLGLNNLGDIVGQADGPAAPFRAFRRNGSSFSIIDVPEFPFSWDARGLSDLGEIVGTSAGRDGKIRGYRATPTALRSVPADPQRVTAVVLPGGIQPNATPNVTPNVTPGPQGPVGPQGPPGPPGPAALRVENPANATRALVATRNALGRGLGEIQGLIARGSFVGNRRGDNAPNPEAEARSARIVAAINLALDDVTTAINFMNENPNAAKIPAVTAPQPLRDLTRQAVRPVFRVTANSLHQATEELQRSPGGDLGGLRAKIQQDIAAAIETVMEVDQAQNRSGTRGRGAETRGAETRGAETQ